MVSKSESNRKYYQKNKDRLAEKWKNDEKRKSVGYNAEPIS